MKKIFPRIVEINFVTRELEYYYVQFKQLMEDFVPFIPAQTPSSSTLSVNGVEQRLLELNRQSAAARSRLLELIELQKQNVAVGVSPSASPVPPSAFSPNTAGMLSKRRMLL